MFQDVTTYFAVGRARNRGDEADLLRLGPRTDSFVGDGANSVLADGPVTDDEGYDSLAPLLVHETGDRHVSQTGDRGQRELEFFGPELLAARVDDVTHTAHHRDPAVHDG